MVLGARRSFSRWTRWCGWLASLRRLPDFAGSLLHSPPYILRRRSSRRLIGFLCGGFDYCWRLALWPPFAHNGAHTCPVYGTLTEPHGPLRRCFSHADRYQSGPAPGGGIPGQLRNGVRRCAVCVVLPLLEDNYSGRWCRRHLFP